MRWELCFFAALGVLNLPPAAFAQLRFPEATVQLGEIRGGAPLAHQFRFECGALGVRIEEIRPGCGCLKPRLTKTTFEPREHGVIPVEIHSLGQPSGSHTWRMQVVYRCNGEVHEQTLQVRGRVVTEVTVQPAALTLDVEGPATQEIKLTDLRAKPLAVVAVKTSSPHLAARIAGPTRDERSNRQFTVHVDVRADLPDGRHDETLHIYTDDLLYQHLKLPITLVKRARERIAVQPASVAWETTAGQSIPARLVRLSDRQGERLDVERVTTDSSILHCTWAVGPGNAVTVKIQLDRDKVPGGTWSGAVRVELRSPVRQIVTIPVTSHSE